METIKSIRQNKAMRVFLRQTFNGFVTLTIAYLGDLSGERVAILPFIFAGINRLTKYVNTRYFGDLGVENPS